MAYSIETKDGIVINNIPDNVPHDSEELKTRVAQIRAGNTQKQPAPEVQAPTAPKNYTLPESIGNAALNFVPDLGHVLAGAGHAIMHPVDTIAGIGKTALGGMANAAEAAQSNYNDSNRMLPKGQYNLPGTNVQAMQQGIKEAQVPASALGNLYKERYGSYEGFKKALAEHPAEVMADVSTVLSGGAGLATKGTKLADALTATSTYTNPLTPATKLIDVASHVPGSVSRQVLGLTTGVGADTIGEAYKAGKAGNDVFMQHLTGTAEPTEVLNEAKNALNNIKAARSEAYKTSMEAVKNDKSILSFDDINKSLDDAYQQFVHGVAKGTIKSKEAQKALNDVQDAINEWKNHPDETAKTPQAFDDMKQSVGSIYEHLPYGTAERTAVGKVYNSIKDTIKKQAPTYEKTMEDYASASDLVSNIEKTLSLNPKASVDTAMRKLQSLTRNNVQTNYGQRVKLADELAKYGGENIKPALAGQAMNEWLPRGLVGKGEDIAALGATLTGSPAALAFPLAMPRVVGTAAYGAGKVAGKVPNLPITANKANQMAQLLYQMHNATQGEQ
jgi:hypothetical protein